MLLIGNPGTRITVDEVLELPFLAELNSAEMPSPFDKDSVDNERDIIRVMVNQVDLLSGRRTREVYVRDTLDALRTNPLSWMMFNNNNINNNQI
eukprot:gnl/Chilomastix_caulleri/4750.p1 GENE.gnl/Chilomastix_caulleri/4750~~gnl/Chilomastix_caulleri/4750.p1  ORF type:complete len:94 (-),score=23.97 gnl/Chilomastix_caulleri/4750:151-432(-)